MLKHNLRVLTFPPRYAVLLPISLVLLGVCGRAAAAPDAAGKDTLSARHEPSRGELNRLLAELDSPRFDVRQRAAEKLEALVGRAEWGTFLAAEFRRTLRRPEVSFEVRWHLNRWIRRLPEPPLEPATASPEELDRLVRHLDDESCAVRLGAADRMEWLLGSPQLACEILSRVKRRLNEASLSTEARSQLEAAWERARGAWLLTESGGPELPAVTDEQMQRWLDDLVRPAGSGESANSSIVQGAARRELLDLLARDEYVPRLTKAIAAMLDRNLDANAAARMRELHDWTAPALAAEYWHSRRPLNPQFLLLGVPTLSRGALRPTHFDRIDDHVAHCVSGNSLSRGDYPVGVAFPHPRQEDAAFHIVNLPTPRRRMAYQYHIQTDTSKRLSALSRRTFDRLLAENRQLTEPELVMLAQLDPREVSRFAGRYLLLWSDERPAETNAPRIGGRPSCFGMIAAQLAADGTKDAVPGLTAAIAKNAFLPPTPKAPYRLDWVAALSIAGRDPWPEVDAWLADHIAETALLVEDRPIRPEAGATVAAILLRRHGETAASFGLEPAAEPLLAQLHVDGYRFTNAAARQKVQQWWDAKKF